MAVHDMDILERLRRIVTKGHEPTDADALAAIAEIARLQLANKQSMEMADRRCKEKGELRAENERLTAALELCRQHIRSQDSWWHNPAAYKLMREHIDPTLGVHTPGCALEQ